jgi:hypothetical protein
LVMQSVHRDAYMDFHCAIGVSLTDAKMWLL